MPSPPGQGNVLMVRGLLLEFHLLCYFCRVVDVLWGFNSFGFCNPMQEKKMKPVLKWNNQFSQEWPFSFFSWCLSFHSDTWSLFFLKFFCIITWPTWFLHENNYSQNWYINRVTGNLEIKIDFWISKLQSFHLFSSKCHLNSGPGKEEKYHWCGICSCHNVFWLKEGDGGICVV